MLRRLPSLVLALLIVATIVSVPASAANREHQQMMADIRMLQEQTQQLQLTLAGLTDAIRAVSAKLDEQAGASRKAFADEKLMIDTVTADIRVVREKVDDNNVRISSLSQDVEALRLAIPQTPPAGQAAPTEQPPGEPAPGTPPAPAQPVAGQQPVLGVSPQRAYDTAWADYAGGQYTLAIEGFEAYIKNFPRSDLAGDAQYFIGESQYQQGNFKEAVAAYDRVIGDYPASRKIPDAYYKRGLALNAMGLADRARESWEFVVKTHPNSDAGRLARQRLEQAVKK
jgi:tol-pal system protein YbgF